MAAAGWNIRVRHDVSNQVHTLWVSKWPTVNEFEEHIFQNLHSHESGVTSAHIKIVGTSSGCRDLPQGDVVYTLDGGQHIYFRLLDFETMVVQPAYEAARQTLVLIVNVLLFILGGLTPQRREVLDALEAMMAPRPAVQEARDTRRITVRPFNSADAPLELLICNKARLVDVEDQVFRLLQRTDIKADQVVLFKDTPQFEFPAPFSTLTGDDFVYFILGDSTFPLSPALTNSLNQLLGSDPSPMRREVLRAMQACLIAEGENEMRRACVPMGHTICNGGRFMIAAVANAAEANKHNIASGGAGFTPKQLAALLLEDVRDSYPSAKQAFRMDVDKERWRDFLSQCANDFQGRQ